MADDFSLFPPKEDPATHLKGLLRESNVQQRLRELRELSVDDYIEQTVLPAENKARMDARTIIRQLRGQILLQGDEGPLYWAEVILEYNGRERCIGFLTQNRAENNGVWMPEHHRKAVKAIRGFTQRSLPIVTFIDTPGADAGAAANADNQAHSISHLIAEMAQIDVPCVGIIIGRGYSGGAIPLATVNILLSVRDGVFNTIQPPGLASIVRKYDLSWQECAKYVGVSAYELYEGGYVDGIIDYVPGERTKLANLREAIFSSIEYVEQTAMDFVSRNPYIFEHYRLSTERFLKRRETLRQFQNGSPLSLADSPTTHVNIFGVAYRYLRYLGLRKRIRAISMNSYGRLSELEIPKGDLQKRAEEERVNAFNEWLLNPLELRYNERLLITWKVYLMRKKAQTEPVGRFRRIMFGTPQYLYTRAKDRLCLRYALYLYNLWKSKASGNFLSLTAYLMEQRKLTGLKNASDMTVLDVIRQEEIRRPFIEECENLLIFDSVYDNVIKNLVAVAREAKELNVISEDSVSKLLDAALYESARILLDKDHLHQGIERDMVARLRHQFESWLQRFMNDEYHADVLKSVEGWKKQAFPYMSETLFAIVTFYFEQLLPRYYSAHSGGKGYDGRIQPRNIGIKDFWNRLTIAYRDLLIQELLERGKRMTRITPDLIVRRFFHNFHEINKRLMTADPVGFPGFRISIEESISRGVTPCGLITGIGQFKGIVSRPIMGVAISNLEFQAGAFDMASARKFCDLLRFCMRRNLPLVCFISSAGMQTKEGAGALFSMPIINDRLTRFIRDQNLPVICFGFGDCTGGAQASFVTHPLVQTYYFSGANMPFAGQLVVPSYLPSTSTLSNYLSRSPGSMKGLVEHPFYKNLDEELLKIDPSIPVPRESIEEVVSRILEGRFSSAPERGELSEELIEEEVAAKSINKVLIHARGCPAAILVRKAREQGIGVVLVQSDADADSVLAERLGDQDMLVCIGGNTPDESYLNALSIIRIAEQEKVDAIHPGIGFLSENSQFAALCRSHGLIFVGPGVHSMELMGNKSNAINTAKKLNVPVVKGSEGIVTSIAAAKRLASQVGYPVLIKAVYGGGGKGIRVVNNAEVLADAFRQIRAEAKSSFGNSDVYLEKYVTSMRHVEVQILRDKYGNTVVLGLRDCTIQRNNQKILEESDSVLLPSHLEKDLYRYAAAIVNEIEYEGAGTVEFIYDIQQDSVYFMEMNTRLQVEHPVTEAVTGLDIVKAQFDIAAGRRLEDLKVSQDGYALEVRINAESLVVDEEGIISIKPSPGTIVDCHFPDAPDVMVITCIAPGKTIPPFYDNLIAQVICKGRNREDAIQGMARYLESILIQGVSTNIPLLRLILVDDIFLRGNYDTNYLPELLTRIDANLLIGQKTETMEIAEPSINAESILIKGTDELKVVAPSGGVFHLTSSQNDRDMVKVGDVVDLDAPLCLLEVMKLFTTITLGSYNQGGRVIYSPDRLYRIVRILPLSGQMVNINDLLFVVQPVEETK